MWILRIFASVLLFSFFSVSESHNILIIYPHVGKSHFMVFEKFFETLANKGHNVTVIGFFPRKIPIPNYRDITITTDDKMTGLGLLTIDMFQNPRHAMFTGADLVADLADYACKPFLVHPNLKNFLKENNTFDLVFVELFNTNCHLGLANKFKAPIIGKWTYNYIKFYRRKRYKVVLL